MQVAAPTHKGPWLEEGRNSTMQDAPAINAEMPSAVTFAELVGFATAAGSFKLIHQLLLGHHQQPRPTYMIGSHVGQAVPREILWISSTTFCIKYSSLSLWTRTL